MTQKNPKLKEFLATYPGFVSSTGKVENIPYQNLSIDSRTIQTGQFFIPLKGENFDGHEFLTAAVEKGASGIAVELEWYSNQDRARFPETVKVIVVKDTLNFLQKLSAWHRQHFMIPVAGIAGSNGKTTVRKMITKILSSKYTVLTNEGNKNNQIGVPLTLLRMNSSHQVAAIELGTNHPGEIAILTELIKPDIGVITNIGKGHIGFFGSVEEVYREKRKLFENMKSGSVIFKNMEDGFLRNYQNSNLKVIRVGSSPAYDYYGRIISSDQFGCVKFSINGMTEISLRIPGLHLFQNALMAAAVGLFFGLPAGDIKAKLEDFQPAKQRMQIYEKDGVLIINDAYNANPDSTVAAIDYLANLPAVKGRKIIAIGDMLEMGDFGEEEHRMIGKFINGKPIDFVFLYGPLSEMIKKGIMEANSFKGEMHWYETHEEIANHLAKILAPNDVLLIKGSRGMKMENVLKNLFKRN